MYFRVCMISSIYNEQCKYQEAELLYKECLEKQKLILGDNHPQTLNTVILLGIIKLKIIIKKQRYYIKTA